MPRRCRILARRRILHGDEPTSLRAPVLAPGSPAATLVRDAQLEWRVVDPSSAPGIGWPDSAPGASSG